MYIMQSHDTNFNDYTNGTKNPWKSIPGFSQCTFPQIIWRLQIREFPQPNLVVKSEGILILKCSEKSGLGRCTVDGWEIRQTHQLRLVVPMPLICTFPVSKTTSKPVGIMSSCHARSSFQKSSSEVQRELGLDYAFANTLEVDETTGRWVAWRDENWSGGFTYFLFSPLLGEMIQFD